MANFKQHLSFSTTMGVAYGATAHVVFGVSPSTSILAGGLCSVSGMLPDVDSNSGKPLRESLSFGAAVVAMMLANRLESLGLAHETIVLSGAGVYLAIRFLFARFLKKFTVHRGMFHSLPAMVIFGELTYLLSCGDERIRLFKACAVMAGYLSHLLLDELFSIEWHRGRLRLKKSFGTAIKMYSPKHMWPNLSTYAKLGLLSYVIFYAPGWLEQWNASQGEQFARETIERLRSPEELDPLADTRQDDEAESVAEKRSGFWR